MVEFVDSIEECYDLDLEESIEVDNDKAQLAIMKCILSIPTDPNACKWTNIFHTFILCKDKICKVVIDGCSTMNVIAKSIVNRFSLNLETTPSFF